MESTALTARLPILTSRYRSKTLSPSPFAGARRLASVSFSFGSGRVVLLSRGGKYAGVGSSVFAPAAAAASGEAVDSGSEAILLSVQGMMCDGCAASVKRILESQPEVTSATVDFKEASAVYGQQPRPRRQKIGRSNVERNLLSTLALVDLSLSCKIISAS
uniref:HMA domain-containing protein n=1 Tax=Arundo donax TaxID=35708 RepID=A0A0A9G5Y7_ARUDO